MSRLSAVVGCFTALGLLVASLEPARPAQRDDAPPAKGDFRPEVAPTDQKSNFGSSPSAGQQGEQQGDKADRRPPPNSEPLTGPLTGGRGGEASPKPDQTMPVDRRGRPRPPDIVTRALSLDAAKRAVDAFVTVRDKYTGDGIENYNSLEAFVAETEAGKRLEADIIAHGFANITDWNLTIMAVGSAYSAIRYDYATDLRQQIEAVRQDQSLDEEMRARLLAGLAALMPSRNNRTVLQALFDDPIYREKLKLLEEEE